LFARKVISWKPLSKLSYLCLSLGKLVNEKHFPVKGKCFPFILGGKHFLKVVKKIRNIILFADYIKFSPQTFDGIYFVWIFFLILSLKIWFNLILILTLVLIFIIVICFSLIIFLTEIFYLSNLILILLIVTYFIWNNLWNYYYYYYYFNFIILQFFYLLDLISIILIIIYFI